MPAKHLEEVIFKRLSETVRLWDDVKRIQAVNKNNDTINT